jgi:hypothetical protein
LEGKLEFRGCYFMFDSYERELYSAHAFLEYTGNVLREVSGPGFSWNLGEVLRR